MLNASPAAQLLRPIVLTRPIRLVEPNSWVTHIPFAFWVVDALRPRVVVELGTQSGNSYAALVQAVQALNLEAACYAVDTWQGDPQAGFYGEDVFAEWAAFHDRHFAGCSRLMRTTFDEARAHFSDDSIDLLHIDGLHTLEAVRHDFETWRGALSARGVVLFHDINVRELEFGAWRLWEEVRDAHPSFEFTHGHGLGVLAVGGEAADDLRWLTGLRNDDEGTALARRFFHGLGDSFRLQLDVDALEATREALERAREDVDRRLRDVEARLGESEHTGAAIATERDKLSESLGALRCHLVDVEQELSGTRQALAEAAADRHRLASDRDTVSLQLRDLEARSRESAATAANRQKTLSSELARATDQNYRLAESSRRRLRDAEAARQEAAVRAVSIVAKGRRAEDAGAPSRIDRVLRRLRQAGLSPGFAVRHPIRFARGAVRLRHREFRRRVAELALSGVFDPVYYRQATGVSPETNIVARFLLHGDAAHERPHPLFDPEWYVSRHGAVVGGGPPLLHYIRTGGRSALSPHPLFDGRHYVEQWPADALLDPTPLAHFLTYGALGAASPHPLFDVLYLPAAGATPARAEHESARALPGNGPLRAARPTSVVFDAVLSRAQPRSGT